MLKKIFIITLLIILGTSIVLYKIYNKPHIDIAVTEPDLSLDAEFITNEFISDENKANEEYLDQIIEIKGIIKRISYERGKTIISLGKEEMFGNVNCHMLPEENLELQNLKVGQTVTLKGICTGYLLNVILVRCVLIN